MASVSIPWPSIRTCEQKGECTTARVVLGSRQVRDEGNEIFCNPCPRLSGRVDEMIEFFHIRDVNINLLHHLSYENLHSQRLPARPY